MKLSIGFKQVDAVEKPLTGYTFYTTISACENRAFVSAGLSAVRHLFPAPEHRLVRKRIPL
jgi:hypothetical protein